MSRLGAWNSRESIGRPAPTVPLEDDKFFGDDPEWNEKIRTCLLPFTDPQRHRAPLVTAVSIGSGNVLIKDPLAFQRWCEFARDLKAVEMEFPGVDAAVRSVRGDRPVLVIRAISDIVGYRRHPDWTDYACHVAASFTRAFLESKLLNIVPKQKDTGAVGATLVSTGQPLPFLDDLADWELLGRSRTEGLVELRLHQPRLANMPNNYYIDLTLQLGKGKYEYEDKVVSIGLREAFLSLDSPGYQSTQKSMIGERSRHWYVEPDLGCVKIIGPMDKDRTHLVGQPLDNEYLAVIEPAGSGEEVVTVSLLAGRASFLVELADRKTTSVNKQAILNSLIYEGRDRNPQGRVILAHAVMQRKSRK
jgi:hypothetical protein